MFLCEASKTAITTLTLMGKPEPRLSDITEGHSGNVMDFEHRDLGLNSNYITYWPYKLGYIYIIPFSFRFLT